MSHFDPSIAAFRIGEAGKHLRYAMEILDNLDLCEDKILEDFFTLINYCSEQGFNQRRIFNQQIKDIQCKKM